MQADVVQVVRTDKQRILPFEV